jgi:hypothetical protein
VLDNQLTQQQHQQTMLQLRHLLNRQLQKLQLQSRHRYLLQAMCQQNKEVQMFRQQVVHCKLF